MPRPHGQANVLHEAVHGLMRSITHLIDRLRTVVEGHPADLPVELSAKAPDQRGPGKNNAKLRSALRASWARMTPAQRKARVRKMLAGRGLRPKGARAQPGSPGRPRVTEGASKARGRGSRSPRAPIATPVPATIVV